MSHFVFILLLEAIVVLSVSVIGLMIFNWKKKKQRSTQIERLLDQVEENEITRKKQLVNYLTDQLYFDQQSAIELVEDFIAAEKRFTQKFLEIQLNQQPISDFYQYSCEVLDKYLQLVAENAPKAPNNSLDITGDASPVEQEDVERSDEIEVKSKESEANDIDAEIEDPDSQELVSDEVDQASSPEVEPVENTNSSEDEEDEFAEEPDWGDAFAEAEVEMQKSPDQEQ